jgi:ribosomal protein L37AE/L43A
MIELAPTTACMLYLGMTLLVLLGLWLSQHYKTRRSQFFPQERLLHKCEFCHYAYLDEQSKNITKCPRCGSYNKQ